MADAAAPGETASAKPQGIGRVVVACITDNRFAELAGPMLASLFENGEVDDFEVIVFGLNLNGRMKKRLRQSSGEAAGRVKFRDIDAAKPPLSTLMPTRWSLSPANYARLVLPALLQGECDRLIFLDCDILIHASLKPLAATDLEGFVVGAVLEDQAIHPAHDERLPLSPEVPYFNAGVMVIDVARWLSEKIAERCFQFIAEHEPKLRFAEQDALNCVLAGAWKELPREWNVIHRRSKEHGEPVTPFITHFAGGVKPWSRECTDPARELFLHYRSKTPWRKRRLITRFERRMGKILQKRLRTITVWWRRQSS